MNAVISYIFHGFMLLSLLLWVLQIQRWRKFWPVAYLLSALLIVFPINGVLIIEYSRGFLSDLSVTTLMFVFISLTNRLSKVRLAVNKSFYLFAFLLGIFLYPASMGLTIIDPFVFGYSSNSGYLVFVLGLALIAIAAIFMGQLQIGACIILSLIAYNLKIYEAQNIWNYLIDPISFIYCVIALMVYTIKYAFQRFKNMRAQYA